MSEYALWGLGFGLVGFAVAAAAYLCARSLILRRLERFGQYTTITDVNRAIEASRAEFSHAIANTQSSVKYAEALGQRVIEAVRPIELALKDLHQRLVKLEEHTDEIVKDLSSFEVKKNHPINREEVDGQLLALTRQISSLEHTIEAMKVTEERNVRSIEAIEATIRAMQSRAQSGDDNRADLATQIGLLDELLKKAEVSRSATDVRLVELEQRYSETFTKSRAFSGSDPALQREPKDAPIGSEVAVPQKTRFDGSIEENKPSSSDECRLPLSPPTDSSPDEAAEEGLPANDVRIPPERRGGGSRLKRGRAVGAGTRLSRSALPNVELVATRTSGDWEISVEVETSPDNEVRVLQGINPIPRAADSCQFGPLRDLTTPLRILSNGLVVFEQDLLGDDAPIMFFRYQDDFAREVARPTRGMYLVVAPSFWRFDETAGVSSPIEPEQSTIPGYKVNFLSFNESARILLERPGTVPFEVELTKPKYILAGRSLPDVDEEMGPLFGGEVPIIQANQNEDIGQIATLVVGAEGRGAGRWRKRFSFRGHEPQEWRDEIVKQGSGWYFVRIYDSDVRLIDSLDFRYVAGLRDIESANAAEALDRAYMHVKFSHDERISVNLMNDPPYRVRRSASISSTTFSWPIDPSISRMSFGLRDGERTVRVTLHADRIWWAVSEGVPDQAPDWQSSAIELDRDDFVALSRTTMLFRLPPLASLTAFVGFDRDDRRMLTQKSGGHLVVYLNSFSEAVDVNSRINRHLKLWVSAECLDELVLTVATLNISHKCPWCELWMSGEEMFDHILDQHHDRCFERLEMRGEGLSESIVLCTVSGCGQYYPVSALPGENAIDRLGRHSNQMHPRTPMKYRKIDDARDIQNLIGLRDEWVWRCRIGSNCYPITPSVGDENVLMQKKQHLEHEHFGDLFDRNTE